jgi:hypothetical protein
MNPQPSTTPSYRSALTSPHLHTDGDICPFCEQEIPPEKLEEISGKIAVRESERERTIRTTLDEQYAIDRVQADIKAAAALELERQQSAAREELAREEARKAAEAISNEKLATAERARQVLQTALQEQAAKAETAQAAAVKAHTDLLAQFQTSKQETAAALAVARTEAATREKQIRLDATQAAEKAVAEGLATQETARQAAEVELLAKIAAANEMRVAAEQDGATLKLQLDALAKAKESEVAQLKEAAAVEAARIKKEATDAAQVAVIQQLAEKDGAIAAEKAKATEAESKIALLSAQHELTLQQSLGSQRELLERAKDEAISAEKARAFDENQKLSNKVGELQRALDKKSNEELGEGAEVDLFEALKKEFPDDDVVRVAKGAAGADITHVVMHNRKICGTIVYDSKNHLVFRNDHVTKLRSDQLAQKAEHAILSLRKFPSGKSQLCAQDGVLLANPARVVSIVIMLRQHLVQVHTLRISAAQRESKTVALYDFITSDRYSQLLARVDAHAEDLLEQQVKEKKQHDATWRKNGELIRSIQKANADISAEVSAIIGTAAGPEEATELEESLKEIS